MNMLGIIILAIIQGVSEFLPISSSAHLIIFREVFHFATLSDDITLLFDIALHFGTLLAIMFYFYKDLSKILIAGITNQKNQDKKLFWYLIIATIPAAISGLLFEDIVDNFFRKQYLLIAIFLLGVGIIIYYTDKLSKSTKDLKNIKLIDALIIGSSQVLALMPGFSRSGTTIATSRLLKLNKEDACKFSFYLSTPVILGATILSLVKKNNISLIVANLNVFIIGILVSFIIGYLTIHFLLKFIKNNDFKIFMIYRILLAVIIIIKLFI